MNGTLLSSTGKINRQELALIPTPAPTASHKPIPHHEIVQALVETLGFRHIGVVHDEYAVSTDGMKMFGILELEAGMTGVRFSIGLRNANDKSMRLALTVGYRVMVCSNMAFHGDFTPVLAKHSKSFSLVDAARTITSPVSRSRARTFSAELFITATSRDISRPPKSFNRWFGWPSRARANV